MSCANGIQDGDETGVDCGGSVCAQCVSSCANNVRDGDEVGVDCGGSCSPSCCENGQHDVESGEEGVDCGGPCATSCASCVASELPFGVCRVQTASSCQYKCATLSTECLHEACEPLACVDRMAGWSGELCHALLPVSLCQIDSETCVMDNANDASECATLAVPSTRVLARCDIECRKPDSCGMGEKFDKLSDQCFTSGQRDCGTDYECSDQGRCVKVTPPVCSDVCAVPDELYGGCRPACHAFPCIASPSCHDIPEAPCLQIVVGVDKGQCKRALESVAACLDRTTCDAMSSSCDDDTVFLECGSVSCARAAPTRCVIGARVDSLSISDICYNDYQYACAQDKTCSEYGECIPKHTIHVKAYAFLSDGDESRLDERLRNALQQTVSASTVSVKDLPEHATLLVRPDSPDHWRLINIYKTAAPNQELSGARAIRAQIDGIQLGAIQIRLNIKTYAEVYARTGAPTPAPSVLMSMCSLFFIFVDVVLIRLAFVKAPKPTPVPTPVAPTVRSFV